MTDVTAVKTIKNKKFIITGGAGFLGSHMCDLLLEKGADVVCIDNLSSGKKSNIGHLKKRRGFRFHKKDVNVLKNIEPIFKKEKPDYVMHYAAMVGVDRTGKNPLGVFRDVEGIKNIAELSRRMRVKKILFTSSSEVYGEPIRLPIAEDDTFNGKWPYSLVKIFGEQYFLAYYEKYGIPVTILRYFNVYGPRQDFGSGFVVSVFLKRALDGKPLEIMGTGEQTRDFVFVKDNVRLSLKAFMNDKINGHPMNIGSGHSIAIKELAERVSKLVAAEISFRPLREHGEIKYRTPDVSFMKKMLKDEPRFALAKGLQATLEYFKGPHGT